MNHWADLHCHTNFSDGSSSPEELILLAKNIGLKGLSITDHDTIAAYPSAIQAAKDAGIHLGSGVEFSCQFEGKSLHILGYDFLLESLEIQKLCERHKKRREDRNRAILKKLGEYGIDISYDELLKIATGATIGRPHIAQAMVEKGAVKDQRAAFQEYLGEDKKCYVPGEVFSVEEAISVIHSAQGKAFIAHPVLLPYDFPIEQLLKLPFDGIECYYSHMVKKSWIEAAKGRGWIMSGGSDFHGTIKPETKLGSSGVDEETFYKIFEKTLT